MEESQPQQNPQAQPVQPAQPAPQKKEEHAVKKPGMVKRVLENFVNKLQSYRRVIAVAAKPTNEEIISEFKITGLGILVIGLIGFIIFVAYRLLVPAV
ncbi:MAG TPA: protein translocase SEC61 complex subunit gamma [archaeon]|nr:protein translocase SEC61 complex subunit gamma [archaeon]